jgi:autotransporter-associated beta strand protein
MNKTTVGTVTLNAADSYSGATGITAGTLGSGRASACQAER